MYLYQLGKEEKASTTFATPFVVMEYNPETKRDEIGGYETKMMREIAKGMNMNLTITTPTDGMYWGEDPDGDGILNGIVGDLQLKKREFGFAQLLIMYHRSQVIDYSEPYDFDYSCFLLKKPKPLPQFYALGYPLTWDLWICITGKII